MIKKCSKCKIEKPFTEFAKDRSRSSGLASNCKKCRNFLNCEIVYKYKNSEHGLLQLKMAEIFSPSSIKKRGLAPSCTKEEIRKHFFEYVKIHGRNCFYCKEPWTYMANRYIPGNGAHNKSDKGKSRKDKLKNLSIDRLDSSKTYSVDNIVFCCTECNLSKKDISIKLVKRLYEIIIERNL
jgi:hypothetical protein